MIRIVPQRMKNEQCRDQECLDYVLPARHLRGTRAEVLDELDEVILGLVGLRQMISVQERASDPKPTTPRLRLVKWLTLVLLLATPRPSGGQAVPPPAEPLRQDAARDATWQYGGFVDAGYLVDFNDPPNKLFRSRGTAWHVDGLYLNMSGAYAKKKATEQSRWGTEVLVQTGKDDEVFGFSATAPPIAGAEWLRHLGLANVSYLAPTANGLTLQGGIFPSLIGYDSLYAKDNFNYTRPWGADFTPYLMLGFNASYPFTDKLMGTFYVINGYWHLANANSVPSCGVQFAYKASRQLTVKETMLWGPHQTNTSFEFWRMLSDTIIEHRTDRVIVAGEYHFATEEVDAPRRPRAWWMAAQIPIRWNVRGPVSIAVRPEIAWDSHGRWTLAEQTVKAVTSTVEYRVPYRWANGILRLEHRFDESRGPGGGFFAKSTSPSAPELTPRQHLLVLAAIITFDSSAP